jgi:hypothetical protein
VEVITRASIERGIVNTGSMGQVALVLVVHPDTWFELNATYDLRDMPLIVLDTDCAREMWLIMALPSAQKGAPD